MLQKSMFSSPVEGGVPMQHIEADGGDMPSIARREVAPHVGLTAMRHILSISGCGRAVESNLRAAS